MWTARFRPEIESDLRDGEDWYESKLQGLGHQFLEEYWRVVDRVVENPLQFAIAPNGLRPCRLKRFSYIVYYRVTDHEILFVAVMSGFRDETALRDRG